MDDYDARRLARLVASNLVRGIRERPFLPPAWLTARGASEYTGLRFRWIERLIEGDLVKIRRRGVTLIHRASLDAFIFDGRCSQMIDDAQDDKRWIERRR